MRRFLPTVSFPPSSQKTLQSCCFYKYLLFFALSSPLRFRDFSFTQNISSDMTGEFTPQPPRVRDWSCFVGWSY